MSFELLYDSQPIKFLRNLEKEIARRISNKTVLLKTNPYPSDSIAIEGEHGVFRIRIGDYRALYRVNRAKNEITIIKIGKREDVY